MKLFCTKNVRLIVGLLTAGSASIAAAETPTDLIHKFAGCFKVVFRYVEDGKHDEEYAPILEKAEITGDAPIVIKRTLIIAGQQQPHWTEEWSESVDGTWMQRVSGPFGDLRYSCEGPWLLNQWSCTADHAIKPRRDSDRPYDHLRRLNTLQVNDDKWVHVQTNHKLRADGSIYSVEVGWHTYERTDESLCL